MKKLLLFVSFSLLLSLTAFAVNPRSTVSINESWRFLRGDNQDVLSSGFDDRAWEIIAIPHTWNQDDAADETSGYYRGIGWYRRNIIIPSDKTGKQVFISFDGANQETELYVNGIPAGTHAGGYTRFCFDITGLIQFGKSNTFAIRMNNSYNENIAPLTADFTFFGGVYRDVNLIYTEKQHISNTYFASSGVFITTPLVSDKEARVSIKTLVVNDAQLVSKVRIENRILSPDGLQIGSNSSTLKLAPHSTVPLIQENNISNPRLWSPDSPSLYQVITRVYDGKTNTLLDEVINPLGLRWFEFTADHGFFLNGKSIKLIGTSRHQCFLNMGNAISDEIHVRDIKLLKEMGANFLRVAHYPQDHTVMEMCDKLGIICSVEIPVVNTITENDSFTNNCLTMAREMVMHDFNRPSVMIWTYMNEVLLRPPYKDDSIKNAHYLKSVALLASKLENQIRQDDPARYTMIPCHGSLEAYLNAGLCDIPKLIGFNLYQGWYSGTFDGFGKFLDNARKKLPLKPIIISEYGADVDPRLHSFEPQRFDYTQEYANLYHEEYIKAILKRPFVAGAAIWNLNDFYSEDRANAVPHVNNKGIASLNREVKDTYLQYRAMLSKKPVVAIGGMNWTIRGGQTNQQGTCIQPVKVYSNQNNVELFLNGISLGIKPVIDFIAQFDVPFINGQNILDASAVVGSATITDQLKIDFRALPFDLKSLKDPFNEINVLLGSKRYFEDKTGSVIWIPEKEYTPGSWGYVGGQPYQKRSRYGAQPASDLDILGTVDDPVYQTMRVGIKAFKMDVPDGRYTISLYWAELQSAKETRALAYNLGNDAIREEFVNRSFDVDINQSNVVKDLNLSKDYGEQRAVIRKFEVDVTNGEGIIINFKKGVGEPILNAIRVYRNY